MYEYNVILYSTTFWTATRVSTENHSLSPRVYRTNPANRAKYIIIIIIIGGGIS